MGNKEHLEILKAMLAQGTTVWNEWRKKNSNVEIDLSGETLNGADMCEPGLAEFNLHGLDLSKVNLFNTHLLGLNLFAVNFRGANLRRANLSEANLMGANFIEANLSGADLKEANLCHAKLNRANLNEANLRHAKLNEAQLIKANLSNTDLLWADLSNAKLKGAELWNAELKGAVFQGANLSGADLRGASLNMADFKEANLSNVILLGTEARATDFSKAILTGACIEDWHTNTSTNLDGVVCDYIYQKFASYHNHLERRPHSRNFQPGEFTKLYQKALETVDIVFQDGIEWKAFLLSFLELKAETGSDEITIQSFENRNGALIVRINVPPDADKAEVEKSLEEKYQCFLKAKDEEILFLREEIVYKRQENTRLIGVIETMAEKEGSKYHFYQNQIGNFIDTAESGSRQQSINHQHNYAPEQKQTLAEAAAEIQKLLKQLEAQGYSPEAAQQQVASDLAKRVQSNPEAKSRLAQWVKYLGDAAANGLIGEATVTLLKSVAQLVGIPIP